MYKLYSYSCVEYIHDNIIPFYAYRQYYEFK